MWMLLVLGTRETTQFILLGLMFYSASASALRLRGNDVLDG